MKSNFRYPALGAVVFLILYVAAAGAEPLYDQYLNTPKETLKKETTEMSDALRKTFSEGTIERSQQRIDFADYYANFKKMVLYGAKLANYADYEENLAFARDKELFKSLSSAEASRPVGSYDQKAFVQDKYEQMKVNVGEEIDTYLDLITISLNACEIMSANDLSGFSGTRENQDTIRRYLDESEAYQVFSQRYERMEKTWPDLAARISRQITFWEAPGKLPDDPIIDPTLTGAIL